MNKRHLNSLDYVENFPVIANRFPKFNKMGHSTAKKHIYIAMFTKFLIQNSVQVLCGKTAGFRAATRTQQNFLGCM